jgi:Ala-tRNA(Pro) deacylase
MIARTLQEYLERNRVRYVRIDHPRAITAQEVAAAAHVPGHRLAKTVVVRLDGRPALVMLPASDLLDLERLREAAGARHVELAAERDFAGLFPDCEAGAMPPFGNLYGMEVYESDRLAEAPEILFNGGSHDELVKLAEKDFEALVHPHVVAL